MSGRVLSTILSLKRVKTDVCDLRLDFESFSLAGPEVLGPPGGGGGGGVAKCRDAFAAATVCATKKVAKCSNF